MTLVCSNRILEMSASRCIEWIFHSEKVSEPRTHNFKCYQKRRKNKLNFQIQINNMQLVVWMLIARIQQLICYMRNVNLVIMLSSQCVSERTSLIMQGEILNQTSVEVVHIPPSYILGLGLDRTFSPQIFENFALCKSFTPTVTDFIIFSLLRIKAMILITWPFYCH